MSIAITFLSLDHLKIAVIIRFNYILTEIPLCVNQIYPFHITKMTAFFVYFDVSELSTGHTATKCALL